MEIKTKQIVTGLEMRAEVIGASTSHNNSGCAYGTVGYPKPYKSSENLISFQSETGEVFSLPVPKEVADALFLGKKVKITIDKEINL